jgi:signal transduction histidine kinase
VITHRLAGEVAIDLARQLAEPCRALRDRLGLVVDHLERHVATSTGPTPYPWRSLQTLRHDLGATYLEATALARRLDELDRVLGDSAVASFELVPTVDIGLRLAGHHLTNVNELMIDLGETPRVRGAGGALSLIVAQLVAACAESARALPTSTLSIKSWLDGGEALVAIADNGGGNPRAATLGELAREILTPWGGTIDAASAEGRGCAFELRLAIA